MLLPFPAAIWTCAMDTVPIWKQCAARIQGGEGRASRRMFAFQVRNRPSLVQDIILDRSREKTHRGWQAIRTPNHGNIHTIFDQISAS